jgi:hypothetical protein
LPQNEADRKRLVAVKQIVDFNVKVTCVETVMSPFDWIAVEEVVCLNKLA